MRFKLIILDRDGVINFDSDNYIKSLEEFNFIPNSIKAICDLSKKGYIIGVATNQSGIFRKYYSLETLDKMHQKLKIAVTKGGGKIEHIIFCPHGPDDNCQCRKPNPGMLKQIMKSCKVSEKETIMVGDSVSDLQAAEKLNISTVLVKTGKGRRSLNALDKNSTLLKNSYHVYNNLYKFSQDIENL